MKPNHARPKTGGFTGWDLLVVVLTVVMGLSFAATHLQPKARVGCGINCTSNLKQVGLAFRMWSNDNGERFPWAVSTNEGGTLELSQSGDPLPHFRAISNEVNSPKVLVCSQDKTRVRAQDFDQFNSRKQLSYFVGLDSSELRPFGILSGDRTISPDAEYHSGLVAWATNAPLKWAPWVHPSGLGNIGFADGSVQQVTNGASWFQRAAHTNPVIRLVIP